MAGEWIALRLDLDLDPAVIEMAEALGLPESHIVGMLHAVWSWASRNCTEQCNASGVTAFAVGVGPASIGRVTRTGNLPELMVRVGWLEVEEIDGRCAVRFPHWDRWNTETAKQRALTARRVARHRDRQRGEDCNADVTPAALPQEQEEHMNLVHDMGARTKVDVRADAIAPLAGQIFHALRYGGQDGGNLWGVAALYETGIGQLTEAEIFSAARGAALNGRDKPRHFYRSLEAVIHSRGGGDLRDLLRRVRILPRWPKAPPYSTEAR